MQKVQGVVPIIHEIHPSVVWSDGEPEKGAGCNSRAIYRHNRYLYVLGRGFNHDSVSGVSRRDRGPH